MKPIHAEIWGCSSTKPRSHLHKLQSLRNISLLFLVTDYPLIIINQGTAVDPVCWPRAVFQWGLGMFVGLTPVDLDLPIPIVVFDYFTVFRSVLGMRKISINHVLMWFIYILWGSSIGGYEDVCLTTTFCELLRGHSIDIPNSIFVSLQK